MLYYCFFLCFITSAIQFATLTASNFTTSAVVPSITSTNWQTLRSENSEVFAAGTSAESCRPQCNVTIDIPLGVHTWWPYIKFTDTVTAATVVVMVNTARNTTATSTRFNELPSGYTLPPRNAAGTQVQTVYYTRSGTQLSTEIAFPSQFFVLPDSYSWRGILQTSGSCQTVSPGWSVVPFDTFPQVAPTSTPTYDPEGIGYFPFFSDTLGPDLSSDWAWNHCITNPAGPLEARMTARFMTATVTEFEATTTPPVPADTPKAPQPVNTVETQPTPSVMIPEQFETQTIAEVKTSNDAATAPKTPTKMLPEQSKVKSTSEVRTASSASDAVQTPQLPIQMVTEQFKAKSSSEIRIISSPSDDRLHTPKSQSRPPLPKQSVVRPASEAASDSSTPNTPLHTKNAQSPTEPKVPVMQPELIEVTSVMISQRSTIRKQQTQTPVIHQNPGTQLAASEVISVTAMLMDSVLSQKSEIPAIFTILGVLPKASEVLSKLDESSPPQTHIEDFQQQDTTVRTSQARPTAMPSIIMGSSTVALSFGPKQTGIRLPNGETLLPASSTKVDGTTYSFLPSGDAIVIDHNTVSISAQSAFPVLTVSGSTAFITPVTVPGSAIVLPGDVTIHPGSVATIDGTLISLEPSGSAIIIGESTIPLPASPATSVIQRTNGTSLLFSAATTHSIGMGLPIGINKDPHSLVSINRTITSFKPLRTANSVNGTTVSTFGFKVSSGSSLSVPYKASESPIETSLVGNFGPTTRPDTTGNTGCRHYISIFAIVTSSVFWILVVLI